MSKSMQQVIFNKFYYFTISLCVYMRARAHDISVFKKLEIFYTKGANYWNIFSHSSIHRYSFHNLYTIGNDVSSIIVKL